MEQTLVRPGGVNEGWKSVFAVWAVLVGVVYVVTDFGLVASVLGMAGLYFVFGGVGSVWQALDSRSVERTAIGSLGGQSEAVQIVGAASPADESVTAPMTGTECVAYRIEVLRDEPRRDHS